MFRARSIGLCLSAGCLAFVLSGCAHGSLAQLEDPRELHAIAVGDQFCQAGNYQAAARTFEQSLAADPDSPAAHLQLARLYDQALPHPALAIYHYEQYLKLDPDGQAADKASQRITVCKRKLAQEVFGLPVPPVDQERFAGLIARHQQLKEQLRVLQADLKQYQDIYASQTPARANGAGTTPVLPSGRRSLVTHHAVPLRIRWRWHTVSSGETVIGIARRFGVSETALLAANPGLMPRRMTPGRVLKIPPT